MSHGVAPPVRISVTFPSLCGSKDKRTLQDEGSLSIEVDVVACCVVDPPRVVDPVHFGRPDVAATGSCLVGPDDFGLSGLQAADGLGSCDADVRPCGGQEIVVAIARVDDERIGAIFGYQRVGERSTQADVQGRC